MRCTRREFHALVAGCLAGCAGGLTTLDVDGGRALLSFAQFPSLRTPGGSAVAGVRNQAPIIVVRTSATDAAALSATCTHAACIVGYRAPLLHCDCHGADFTLAGAVVRGPTVIPLPTYAATVESDGIVVDVT